MGSGVRRRRVARRLRCAPTKSAGYHDTNLLLEKGIEMNASDILIEPWEHSMRVRVRVDGMLREIEGPPLKFHAPIVSRIKVMSELDIAEHRLPQDGRFKVKIQDRFVDFRVSILPSFFGEKVALRILDKSMATLDSTGSDLMPRLWRHQSGRRPHG
jgi:type II secretory ATPase GspE/PulE/Tfp pilus assembly ATPase PilB-like protein